MDVHKRNVDDSGFEAMNSDDFDAMLNEEMNQAEEEQEKSTGMSRMMMFVIFMFFVLILVAAYLAVF